jgi:hypothetical protein
VLISVTVLNVKEKQRKILMTVMLMTPKTSNSEQVNLYARGVSLGLLYKEFEVSICAGGGPGIFRCWKYLLLVFKAAKRKNYSIESFTLLAEQKFMFSPRLSLGHGM